MDARPLGWPLCLSCAREINSGVAEEKVPEGVEGRWGGGIWRQLFCLGASEERKKKTTHRVTALKAREVSTAFFTLPLIETCRCSEVAQNS